MSDVYRIQDRELLAMVCGVSVGFHSPEVVLSELTGEQATEKLAGTGRGALKAGKQAPPQLRCAGTYLEAGAPHSIAGITGHICFWQECFNQIALHGFMGFPVHADDGWPPCSAAEWPAMRDRYLEAVRKSREIARTAPDLDAKLLPPAVPTPFLERDSRRSGVLHGAIHAAHHLGQIVLLRRMMGLWPPSAGSMTW